MPRDADTGVLALSSESEFVFGQSPLVSPMRFKMLSLTSSLEPHLLLGCQLLVQGRNGSDCTLERLEVGEDPSVQAVAQEDNFLHKLWRWVPGPTPVLTTMKLLSIKEWQPYLSRS